MFPKRLLAIGLVAAAILAQAGVLRAQWERCYGSGPFGGSISALGVLGSYTSAGTSGGGIFRSTNNGESWKPALVGSSHTGIASMVVSGPRMFAAGDSLYLSTDSGFSWHGVSLLPNEAGPLAVIGNVIVLASFNGIYCSTDAGKTWSQTGYMFAVVSLLAKDGILYAGAYSFGMYQSTDTGQTWTPFVQGSILDGASIQSLASAGNDIFAGGFYDEGFYRSTDDGVTWDTSNTGLPNNGIPNRIEGNFTTIMSLYEDGSDLLAGTTDGIFISSDSGANWRLLSTIYASVLIRSGANLLAGSGGGIYLSSDNGSTWSFISSGFINTRVTTLASIGNRIFADISGYGVYRSDDSGTTWVTASKGLSIGDVGGFATIDTTLFTMIGRELYKTPNFGTSWDSVTNQMSLPIISIGSNLVAAIADTFYLSTDEGISWTKRGGGLNSGSIYANRGSIYVGTANGDCGSVYVSTDSALSWKNIDLGAGCTLTSAINVDSAFVFAGTHGAIATTPAGIFRRATNENSWNAIDNGFADTTEASISSIVSENENVFFGSDFGVFHSTNYGDSWDSVNDGLTSLVIEQLLIVPPYIFAATYDAGIWRRPLSDFGISSVAQTAPAAPMEIESYPNPFTQRATISFTTESPGYADIRIVNLLGVEVARLYSGELSAGKHSFVWSSLAGLPAGIYECVVRMNGQTRIMPMALTR
ncbi:MAG TPA: hypothetical protein VFH95_08155 [Candidatus Kapabacteria bacterium]|nr:hypothetical protein [Candidatus Kapabacteria bacterium]